MPRELFPPDPARFRGVSRLLAFENRDGRLARFNCGQAAVATLLHHLGLLGPSKDGVDAGLRPLESAHPPDLLGGWCGTGRRRIERALRAYGLTSVEVRGADALRRSLAAARPVLLMLGFPVLAWRGRTLLPGGHWMLAWGYDPEFLYLSNYGRLPWQELDRWWDTWTARRVAMAKIGLGVEKPTDRG